MTARPLASTTTSDHNGCAETVAGDNTRTRVPSANTAPLIKHTRQNSGIDKSRRMSPASQDGAGPVRSRRLVPDIASPLRVAGKSAADVDREVQKAADLLRLTPYLQRDEAWVSIGVCQTATISDFLLFGDLIGRAVASLDRKVVLLASGGLSHKFWPLREIRDHGELRLEGKDYIVKDGDVINFRHAT